MPEPERRVHTRMTDTRFLVTAARHLETLLAEELRGLSLSGARETRAGAVFEGGLADAYRVCLHTRIGARVLLPLAEFPAADAEQLYAGVRSVDWRDHIAPGRTLSVHAESTRSRLDHGQFAALRIKDAVVDQLRERTGARPDVDPERPDVALRCRLFRDRAELYLDLSGSALHRRGWRTQTGAAPLRETLAAAVLLRAGWPRIAAGGGALLDPLCGAGTLVIEAALIAADIAPGLLRQHWGFTGWRGHDATAWEALLAEARAHRADGLCRLARRGALLRGSDQDPAAVRAALANATAAGIAGHVHFERRALADCRPQQHGERGLIVTNPPYGERLGAGDDLSALYQQLGALLRTHFDGWRAAVLTGNPALGKRMGLRAARFHRLDNGPIECRLLHFEISPEAHVSDRPRPLPAAERGPGAAMLANRIEKNRKGLSRWLQREGITCYRLYDADLPEYALAVDVYTSADADAAGRRLLHVQEYAPPPEVDPRTARRRLREALGVLIDAFGIDADDLFFKVRAPQRGGAQYERLGVTGRLHTVEEDGLRLLVNLEDYLDTGLFLDHRETRRLIARLSPGQHMLNLFGYTGTASCHAARGGARSTTTLDLSRTYLDWAVRNLARNGYSGRDHRTIQADCLDWLRNARAYHGHFGLIFLDPPTFSTSKRMQRTFDVQRDHAELIRAAITLLAPGGTLVFSTNRRRFRLDRDALAGLSIDDITRQTLPRDFARNPRIHQCFLIRVTPREKGPGLERGRAAPGGGIRGRDAAVAPPRMDPRRPSGRRCPTPGNTPRSLREP